MRLLKWNGQDEFSLTEYDLGNVPRYVILSHTWGSGDDEVTFADVQQHRGQSKAGYTKLQFCGEQARKDEIEHFWVDTCCINKDNQNELSEAITSMFCWYRDAAKCYVYLSDVSTRPSHNATRRNGDTDPQMTWESSFPTSRWFTRGWTLQELLAPATVEFFSREGKLLGTKNTLAQQIHDITTIPLAALRGTPPSQFPIGERIRWAEKRQTKKKEDGAYCMLGIFEVFIPLLYGEGDNAFRRLRKEINEQFGRDVAAQLGNRYGDYERQPAGVQPLGLCLASAPLIKPNDFVGRSAEIDAIRDVLLPDEVVTEQRRVVLGGIGGIGKTQLAIAYVRRHERSYTSVLWLNATSELTVYASLRSIARALVAADELQKLNNEQILAHVLEWLSRPQNTRWLLIFDNNDDPDRFDVDSFCPNVGHGSIIVTTRLPNMVTGPQVRVQPLTAVVESLDILQIRSGRANVTSDTGACRLAERLDGLPLALVTAGAYLRKTTVTFQQYLDTYDRRWHIDPRRPLRLQDYQDRTLHTTWNMSYSRLKMDDPEAAQMLQLLAYFDHQEMWYELFYAGLSDHSPTWLHASLADRVAFESVMGKLADYCLVEVQHATGSYNIHSCVHDWTLGALNEQIDPELYWYVFDCVAASIDKNDWETLGQVRYARVSRHAVRLMHHRFTPCYQLGSGLSERLVKALWIARMLNEQVQFLTAEQIYQRVLAEYEKALGPDHVFTLDTVYYLGALYADQGKLTKAEEMYTRALAGYEKAHGPEHTSTLDTVNNLGLLYTDQGRLIEAEEMYTRALAKKEKVLGPNHTSTLKTVNNLGSLYAAQDKLDKAEKMYIRALTGKENALGPDHILTLSTVYNLGILYADQDKLAEAEEMYIRALAGYERSLGTDHISTLKTIHGLGELYRAQEGKLDKVEEMHTRVLAGYEKALGPSHTSTLIMANNLGNIYRTQDRHAEAEEMYTRALAGFKKVLGSDHALALNTINNLGLLYADQDKLDEAEEIHTQVLAGYERAHGPDHTSTLRTVNNLGLLYAKQGKFDKAEKMHTRALAGYEKVLGSNHASTLRTAIVLSDLSHAREKRGDGKSSDVRTHAASVMTP